MSRIGIKPIAVPAAVTVQIEDGNLVTVKGGRLRRGWGRLALDTVLGEGSRFGAILLGRDPLATGYLSPAPPMDALDRLVADRDRPGQRPL